MITTAKIIKGLSAWIEAKFGEPPITKDVVEGFDRPCTFVSVTNATTGREGDLRHDTFEVEIVRFTAKSYKGYKDLLTAQDTFSAAFEQGYIAIEGMFYIYPDAIDYDLDREDMLLTVTFTIDNFQTIIETDSHPNMNTLQINSERS